MIATLQVALIDFGHYLARALKMLAFARSEFYANLLGNRPRHFALQGQDFAQLAVVALRPQVFV